MNPVYDALFGMAVGDALGVPFEFKSREEMRMNPATSMVGYGTHIQPAGTWSDDSSLAFCLAEALCKDRFSLTGLASEFVKWFKYGSWTPYGDVFDIGISTRRAIRKLAEGVEPTSAGGTAEHDNGNGSLMRIIPLLFYIKDKPIAERFKIIKDVSSLTHGHIRSVIACFYYLEFALNILETKDLAAAYGKTGTTVDNFLLKTNISPIEIDFFCSLFRNNIQDLDEDDIGSSGYVLDTLEASMWCLMTTTNYTEAVLKAVNLGEDTDTTGAVTGGLAGLYYGIESIPHGWLDVLARKEDIEKLCDRLYSV